MKLYEADFSLHTRKDIQYAMEHTSCNVFVKPTAISLILCLSDGA